MLVLLLTSAILYDKYQKAVLETERIKSNLEFYESKYNSSDSTNIVLRHTIDEISSSRDSLISNVDGLRKKLKLKPKQVNTIVYTETVLRDTIRDTIPVTVDFHTVVTPNDQTSIEITRKDSTLTVVPNIRNEQTVFVYTESKYKYKGFFNRLIHLNFSKVKTDKYVIENSNDLIKTGESRVVNVEH